MAKRNAFIIQHPHGKWLALPSKGSAASYRLVPKYTLAKRYEDRNEAISLVDQFRARARDAGATWKIYDYNVLRDCTGAPACVYTVTGGA